MSGDFEVGPNDWINSFLTFTNEIPSPDIFRLWAGISCLAGVLERKVWMRVSGKDLYPHQYIVLVGPPGSGKTFVSNIAEELWRLTKEHHVAPKSMSFASLGDVLKDSVQKIVRPGKVPPYEEFNSLLIHSRELKVLMPEYSSIMLDRLTDLWDCNVWDERLRGGGINYIIEKPQVHILAGETPSWFNSMIPENAWEGGFLSRTILVWAGEQRKVDLFSETSLNQAAKDRMVATLKLKGQRFGQIDFTPEVSEAIKNWYYTGMEPVPQHPKLRHYISRRHMHLLKLITVSCVSRTDSLQVGMVDFLRAQHWLLTAEAEIEEIFKAAATIGDGKVIEECWYWMFKEFNGKKRPIPAANVSRFISARVPAFHVGRVIQVMEEGGFVKKELAPNGAMVYTPLVMDRRQIN